MAVMWAATTEMWAALRVMLVLPPPSGAGMHGENEGQAGQQAVVPASLIGLESAGLRTSGCCGCR
jgi:hypothetical protein